MCANARSAGNTRADGSSVADDEEEGDSTLLLLLLPLTALPGDLPDARAASSAMRALTEATSRTNLASTEEEEEEEGEVEVEAGSLASLKLTVLLPVDSKEDRDRAS